MKRDKQPRDVLLPVDYSGLHAEPGSEKWILTRRSLMLACLSDIHNNRHVARQTYAEIQKYGGWQHLRDARDRPFQTFEQFCESVNGLRLKKEEIEKRLELGEHGQYGRGRPKNRPDDDIRSISYGTSAAYTLARLDRDKPQIAALVRAGELSANAAAIALGWRKKHVRKKLSAHDQAVILGPKMTREERDDVIDEYRGMNLGLSA